MYLTITSPLLALTTLLVSTVARLSIPGTANATNARSTGSSLQRHAVDRATAVEALFPGGAPAAALDARLRALVARPYAADLAAKRAALRLFDEWGSVVGVEATQTMDGGYRCEVRIAPEWPVGVHARQLEWVMNAHGELARQLQHIERVQGQAPAFRHPGITHQFMRTLGGNTPSAHGRHWTVTYKLNGSLMRVATAVRDLIVHVLFHLNDEARDDWPRRALGPLVERIATRCGTDRGRLAPYAPRSLTVRGGTFYSASANSTIDDERWT